jgi:hypothetical protein
MTEVARSCLVPFDGHRNALGKQPTPIPLTGSGDFFRKKYAEVTCFTKNRADFG